MTEPRTRSAAEVIALAMGTLPCDDVDDERREPAAETARTPDDGSVIDRASR